jgi:hypothetical protein
MATYEPDVYAPSRTPWAGIAARMVLTLAGAAAMIIGPFLDWIEGREATSIGIQALWQSDFGDRSSFVQTLGFVFIVLGLLAIVGLAARTGWLTRIAGALGIVAFVLFAIQVFRASGDQTIQIGAWIALAGSILALVAGFLGARTAVVTRTSTVPAAPATTTSTTASPPVVESDL